MPCARPETHELADWINDAIKDSYRVKALRARKDIRGRMWVWFDGAQGWILVAIIGFITACVAFFVDVTENVLFDVKDGYCTSKSRMRSKVQTTGVADTYPFRCVVLQQKKVLS